MGTLIGTTVAAGHKEFIGNYDISERFKLVSLLHLCLSLVARVWWLVASDDAVRLISRVFGIQQQFTCLANRGLSAPCSYIHLLLPWSSPKHRSRACGLTRWLSLVVVDYKLWGPFVATCILTQSFIHRHRHRHRRVQPMLSVCCGLCSSILGDRLPGQQCSVCRVATAAVVIQLICLSSYSACPLTPVHRDRQIIIQIALIKLY